MIELLPVIAIIGLLPAIIIPVVGKVRESARQATCASNLRQIAGAFHLYAEDHHSLLPASMDSANGSNNSTGGFWMLELNPHVGKNRTNRNADISEFFACPAYFSNTSNAGVFTSSADGIPNRHGTRSNYAFLDGSVRSLDAFQAADLLRWTQP